MKRCMFLFLVLIPLYQIIQSEKCYAITPIYAYVATDNGDAEVGNIIVLEISDNIDLFDPNPFANIVARVPVGHNPRGIAVSPDGKYVYVANYGDDTISVINTVLNTVISNIPVGDGPFGVAINSTGTFVYVTNSNDDSLSIIETGSGLEIQKLDLASESLGLSERPIGVDISSNDVLIYVANNRSNNIAIISKEYDSFGEIEHVFRNMLENSEGEDQAYNSPWGIGVSANAQYVFVSNASGHDITIIGSSLEETTVSVGNIPMGISVNPQGGSTIYVANYLDGTVSIVNPVMKVVSGLVSVGAGPVDLSFTPNGQYLYVLNSLDQTISCIDASDSSVLTSGPLGETLSGFGKFIGGLTPETPTDLVATSISIHEIELSWVDASDSADGFVIERKKGSGGQYSMIALVGSAITTYLDENLSSQRTYYYRINSMNNAGMFDAGITDSDGNKSNEANATTERDYGSCFIATAAYGSYDMPMVRLLRDFRDRFLLTNSFGKAFVDFYYKMSPKIASFIAQYDFLRGLIRYTLLPFVAFSWASINFGLLNSFAFLFLSLSLIAWAGVSFFNRCEPERWMLIRNLKTKK